MHAGDSWYERGGPGGGGHRDPETDQTAEHPDSPFDEPRSALTDPDGAYKN
ncbi:hypothetical protein OIU91_38530 [Streptomyces sp. NBC_01456]|uniref:hypothetical protein n=1 Tax=unclassified Streptomyces TaxID=2593676 RepID=UPI002E36FE24|nr:MULTISPECIES: hypothetical protein [unclassified Streptomyces]